MKKRLLFTLFALTSTLVFSKNLLPEITTPRTKEIKSLMLVGNSFFYYNNSLHHYIGSIVKNDETINELKRRSITINGSALSWHDIGSYLDNKHMGKFRIDSQNANAYVPDTDTKIDVVIMMDCSLCPIHPKTQNDFQKFTREHAETIRARDAEPMLFMSWAYKNTPEMFSELKTEFLKTANENDLLLIPVGEAFELFNKMYPDINLYTSDGRHPSKEGTYMAAAVIFSTLFMKSSFGNNGIMGLNPNIAQKIQKVADIAVEEFFDLKLN
ncbi:MAG: hypothetical protein CMD68_04025 [Gammaproteobacteria bacterium]|nr:hypothetical protein [Gammaproteobacteria bacterium]|tara:strand:+ start:1845 stop:2654 length:810 start_codon:yes stop_codon:yes gene_type:complete